MRFRRHWARGRSPLDSLYILIPIALVFVAIAIKAFIWAVDNRQYDDLDAAGRSILFDEDVEVTVSDEKEESLLKDKADGSNDA